jgi:putative ABC transport system substrate-binding protein
MGISALGLPLYGLSQPVGKIWRIGYLSAPSRESVEQILQVFLRSLHELGWIEGQNLIIEYRWADGKLDRLPQLAADLVQRKVDLIIAPAGTAALAAKNATSTIPIVMIFPLDPVQSGLIKSLRNPGGNVTGTTSTAGVGIFGKQLQLLKTLNPKLARVALLWNPDDSFYSAQVQEIEEASRTLRIRLQHFKVGSPQELESAFAAMTKEQAEAVQIVGNHPIFLIHRAKIAELALKNRLPTMFNNWESVESGGLLAYAVNMSEFIPRSASFIDKILKGAKPADLPVEQPTLFELAINLKTAKTLGITVPRAVLLSANKVIE